MNLGSSKNYLTPFSSIFLDAVRLLAALDVAFTHARAIWFREKELEHVPSHLAHGSVIIFFVLSGYVIAYTTGTQKRSAKEYATARLSRLYSALLPALLCTILISAVLKYVNPDLLQAYSRGNNFWRCVISLFFCNEVWFLSAAPLINGVIWSLSYEFWFYTIFGCWLYRTKNKGWIFLLIAIIIAGPKIIIMMPGWLFGALAYMLPKPSLSYMQRLGLITMLFAIAVSIMLLMPQLPYKLNASKLYWASPFISDMAAALFIATSFWLLPTTRFQLPDKKSKTKVFRKIADVTFPIYVFHYPALMLCKAFLQRENVNYATMSGALIITLAFCFVVSLYIEKLHILLKTFFKKLFGMVPSRSVLPEENKLIPESAKWPL